MPLRLAVVLLIVIGMSCEKSKPDPRLVRAKQRLSEANMKALLQRVNLYTLSNGGRFPDTLEDLRDGPRDKDFDKLMTNPITGENPGYVYRKPAREPKWSVKILWESKDGKPDEPSAIGYADFEVRRE